MSYGVKPEPKAYRVATFLKTKKILVFFYNNCFIIFRSANTILRFVHLFITNSPMCVTESGIVIEVKLVQLENAYELISTTFCGISISFRLKQLTKQQ